MNLKIHYHVKESPQPNNTYFILYQTLKSAAEIINTLFLSSPFQDTGQPVTKTCIIQYKSQSDVCG
jgi:hypothetical protein